MALAIDPERHSAAVLRIGDAMLSSSHREAAQLQAEGYTPTETLDATRTARIRMVATIVVTYSTMTSTPLDKVREDVIAELDEAMGTITRRVGA